MTKNNRNLLLCCLFLMCSIIHVNAQTRETIKLKSDWKFQKGNSENAHKIDFNDSKALCFAKNSSLINI